MLEGFLAVQENDIPEIFRRMERAGWHYGGQFDESAVRFEYNSVRSANESCFARAGFLKFGGEVYFNFGKLERLEANKCGLVTEFAKQEEITKVLATEPAKQETLVVEDQFDALFRMQTDLNNYIFGKKSLNARDGTPLTVAQFFNDLKDNKLGVNDNVNVWLKKYLQALQAEATELDESLHWKWWSKDNVDIQNVRVEIIDMFHFLISLALTAGLTSGEVHRLYVQKWEINLKRQDTGYSKATKTEDDNKTVK